MTVSVLRVKNFSSDWGGLSLRGSAQLRRVGVLRGGGENISRGPPLVGKVWGGDGPNLDRDYPYRAVEGAFANL